MEFELKNKHLIDLYTKGKCKKYNFLNKKAVENFIGCVDAIEAAIVIQDWWELKSLKFEKLEGYEKNSL